MALKDPNYSMVPETTVRTFREMRGLVQTELGLYIPRSNAQTAAAEGKIPIAGAGGKLAQGWIPVKSPVVLYFQAYGLPGYSWANMPAAMTELYGNPARRNKFDATNMTQVRIVVHMGGTAGAAGSVLAPQYSTDGTNWYFPDGTTTICCSTSISSAYTTTESAWANLAAGAKADAYWRIVGANGDGVIDPEFEIISIMFQ